MNKYYRYLIYVLKHKWYVAIECFKHGLIWRGITHDLSAFLPDEFIPFAKWFHGEYGIWYSNTDNLISKQKKVNYNKAWLKHQRRNQHHWQAWVLRYDDSNIRTLQMPDKYVKEMVSDWIGAGKAINGTNDVQTWYESNKDNIILHPTTRAQVRRLIGVKKRKRVSYDYITGKEDDIQVMEGTLTPELVQRLDTIKKEQRAEEAAKRAQKAIEYVEQTEGTGDEA